MGRKDSMDKLLNTIEVSQILGLSTRTIAKWVKSGKISSVKLFSSRRFKEDDIRKLIDKHTRY